MNHREVRIHVLEGFYVEHDGPPLPKTHKSRYGRGRDLVRWLVFEGEGASRSLAEAKAVILAGEVVNNPSRALSEAVSAWTIVFGTSLKQRDGEVEVLRIPSGVWVDSWVFQQKLAAALTARTAEDAVAALWEAIQTYQWSAKLVWRRHAEPSADDSNARHPDPLQARVTQYRNQLVQAYVDCSTLLALMGELKRAYSSLQRWTYPVEGRRRDQQLPGVYDERLWHSRLAVASLVDQTKAVFEAYRQLPDRDPNKSLVPSNDEHLRTWVRGVWNELLEHAVRYACWQDLTLQPRYASSVARIMPEGGRVDRAMTQLDDERDRSSDRLAFWVLGDPHSRPMLSMLLQAIVDPRRTLTTRIEAFWSINQMSEALRISAQEWSNQKIANGGCSDGICIELAKALTDEVRLDDVISKIAPDPATSKVLHAKVRRLENYRQAFRRDVGRRDQEQGREVSAV